MKKILLTFFLLLPCLRADVIYSFDGLFNHRTVEVFWTLEVPELLRDPYPLASFASLYSGTAKLTDPTPAGTRLAYVSFVEQIAPNCCGVLDPGHSDVVGVSGYVNDTFFASNFYFGPGEFATFGDHVSYEADGVGDVATLNIASAPAPEPATFAAGLVVMFGILMVNLLKRRMR